MKKIFIADIFSSGTLLYSIRADIKKRQTWELLCRNEHYSMKNGSPTCPTLPGCFMARPPLDTAAATLPSRSTTTAPTVSRHPEPFSFRKIENGDYMNTPQKYMPTLLQYNPISSYMTLFLLTRSKVWWPLRERLWDVKIPKCQPVKSLIRILTQATMV